MNARQFPAKEPLASLDFTAIKRDIRFVLRCLERSCRDDALAQPYPGDDRMTERFEEGVRVGERKIAIRRQHRSYMGNRIERFARGPRKGIGASAYRFDAARLADRDLHLLRETRERRAILHHDLAPEQIERLDTVRAFMNQIQ